VKDAAYGEKAISIDEMGEGTYVSYIAGPE
jgi:hypothetical protein